MVGEALLLGLRPMEASSASSSSSSSSSKGFMENVEQPHVLAVDDSIIDRKLIEKLLKNLSCKGNKHSACCKSLCFQSVFSVFSC